MECNNALPRSRGSDLESRTYLLSLSTGPPLMSTSKRCTFWYRWAMVPVSSIHKTVFLTLRESAPGSWMPTWIGNLSRRASSCRPRTKGLS